MGTMNLLQADFTGSIGSLTGQKWHGKSVIKSKIWSKAPATSLQTQNIRAFEALNRISAAIAHIAWPDLGLSDKKILKHNAVARWLKPIVQHHSFDPSLAAQVIDIDGSLKISAFIVNRSALTFRVKIDPGPDYIPSTGSVFPLVVFDNYGYPAYARLYDTPYIDITFPVEFYPDRVYYVIAFVSDPAPKGRFIHGLAYKEGPGMRYSTDEQLTSDFWIDGRPIYQKSYSVTIAMTPNTGTQVSLGTIAPGRIIRNEVASAGANSNFSTEGQIISYQTGGALNASFAIMTASTGEVRLAIANPTSVSLTVPAIITIWYTKTADTPIS